MRFVETSLSGVFLIEIEPMGDSRGFFARNFCAREFAANKLNPRLAQASVSFSALKATLRGLHFQSHPAMEDKIVRCLHGALYDVIVDIRPGSPTFGRWAGYELSDRNNLQIYIPQGFAHGFQTLTDNVSISYYISQFYEPERARGIRWNDPQVAISWPLPPTEQSPRDRSLPFLEDIDTTELMPFPERPGQ